MTRILLVLALLLGATTAHAQPSVEPAQILEAAASAYADGDYASTITLASQVAARANAPRADLAEAHRLLGLAYFYTGDRERADAAFFAYLKLEPDAYLAPAQYPDDVRAFFDEVRQLHEPDIAKSRPRQRRYVLLNLIPPGGQIQNRDIGKAWALGSAEVVLIATNLTSYFMLRSWCRRDDFTCESGGADVPDRARTWRTVNYVSGIALIGVYVYGVVDGYLGYRRDNREHAPPIVTVAPLPEGGAVASYALSF